MGCLGLYKRKLNSISTSLFILNRPIDLPSHHQYVFSYHDGDVFGCVADIGWITGHSYSVYGPLANGGTTVLFESTPIYPDPGMNVSTV